ncbi:MAG: hypothetical protein ACRER2_07620 [Methylococcales bacterium]
MARALGLFATLSKSMIKTAPGRFDDAERALPIQLLPHLDRNDRLVRQIAACPSVWPVTLLQQRQWPFLARLD